MLKNRKNQTTESRNENNNKGKKRRDWDRMLIRIWKKKREEISPG